MDMARIYYSDGSEKQVFPANGMDFKLNELQSFVDGYIEVVMLDKTSEIMVVNEEGKLKGLPINRNATEYLLRNSQIDDIIVGDVLVCNRNMVK